jgi:hypothetical protein
MSAAHTTGTPMAAPPGSVEPVVDGLDWYAFSARYHPLAGRHDLEALVAYEAYRANAATGTSDESRYADASALHAWDSEGGALAVAPV